MPMSIAGIEARTAGFHHAQRRVVGRQRAARRSPGLTARASASSAPPRRSWSRNFRSWYDDDQHREHEGHAEGADDQEERRLDGRDQEQVGAAEQRRQHGRTMTVDSISEHRHHAEPWRGWRRPCATSGGSRCAPHCAIARERPEAIAPERRQRHHEQRHGPAARAPRRRSALRRAASC